MIRYSLRLRRVEYRIAELPIFLIPIFLTIRDGREFVNLPFLAGGFIFFFLMAVGDLVNCLADRDLDATYKPHLTEAVDGLGIRNILWQIGLSSLAAIGLAIWIAGQTGRWLIPVAVVIGLATAVAYSVKPIHLKGRGLGQLAFYWFGLFTGPMVMSAMFVTDWPTAHTWTVAVAYGMVQTGVILFNTAEDYPEDLASGIRTAVVELGILPAMLVALGCVMIGGPALVCSFASRLIELYADNCMMLIALGPLTLAVIAAFFALLIMIRQLVLSPLDQQIKIAKQFAIMCPILITAIALTSLLASIMIFRISNRST